MSQNISPGSKISFWFVSLFFPLSLNQFWNQFSSRATTEPADGADPAAPLTILPKKLADREKEGKTKAIKMRNARILIGVATNAIKSRNIAVQARTARLAIREITWK